MCGFVGWYTRCVKWVGWRDTDCYFVRGRSTFEFVLFAGVFVVLFAVCVGVFVLDVFVDVFLAVTAADDYLTIYSGRGWSSVDSGHGFASKVTLGDEVSV